MGMVNSVATFMRAVQSVGRQLILLMSDVFRRNGFRLLVLPMHVLILRAVSDMFRVLRAAHMLVRCSVVSGFVL